MASNIVTASAIAGFMVRDRVRVRDRGIGLELELGL